jgi:hypothetical protein
MFKIPLCLEVIAGDEQDEMLQNMGLKTNSVDPYDEQTFIVCFYKVDAITTDTRSTAKKPLTVIYCGEFAYLCKLDMATLVDRIAVVSI